MREYDAKKDITTILAASAIQSNDEFVCMSCLQPRIFPGFMIICGSNASFTIL